MHANSGGRQHGSVRDRAWVFGLLIAPSAVTANGVIQGGALAYLLSVQHVTSGVQSHLIGLLALPTSLYFLWSPVTDFLVRRRTWLLVGALVAALLMALAFRQPELSSRRALVLMLISAVAASSWCRAAVARWVLCAPNKPDASRAASIRRARWALARWPRGC